MRKLIFKLQAVWHSITAESKQNLTICIFNGWVLELKPKVWDLFANFTTEKLRAVLFWSPLKDTLPVTSHLNYKILSKNSKIKNELIPIGSNALARAKNLIAITDKIINSRNFFDFENFKGEMDSQININENNYFFSLGINNEILTLFSFSGIFLKINLLDKVITKFDYLHNFLKKETRKIKSQNDFKYNYNFKHGRSFCYVEDKIYFTTQDGSFYKYDLVNSVAREMSLNTKPEVRRTFCEICAFENNILCHFGDSEGRKFFNVIDKNSFTYINGCDAIEGFSYDAIVGNSKYLYSKSHGMHDSMFEGKILKISLLDHSYSVFNPFNNNKVHGLHLISNDLIICYSNFRNDEYSSSLKIIEPEEGITIRVINFKNEIKQIKFKININFLVLLFKNGNVSVYEIKSDNLVYKNKFKWYGHKESEANFIEYFNDKLILGNRKQINIYK